MKPYPAFQGWLKQNYGEDVEAVAVHLASLASDGFQSDMAWTFITATGETPITKETLKRAARIALELEEGVEPEDAA